jgi:hypothetical protein
MRARIDLENTLNKLKLCGLHSAPGEGNNLHYFRYKNLSGTTVMIDATDDILYIDFHDDDLPYEDMKHLIQQLLGRFKCYKYIATEYCHSYFMRAYNLHKEMGIKVCPVENNNAHLIYRSQDIPRNTTCVLRNCMLKLQIGRGASFKEYHHDQYIKIDDQGVYIYFDPPIVYKSGGDEYLQMSNQFTDLQPYNAKYNIYPRWNKLRYSLNCGKSYVIHVHREAFYVRPLMYISDVLDCETYRDELKHFIAYARGTVNGIHNLVKRIQRQWRHSISNPEYDLCRRRLLREAREMDI